MDGDSLAPPCGCEPCIISPLLALLGLQTWDVLYDLGCGDGRICFKGVEEFQVSKAVGIEIEEDVCKRMEYLIGLKNLQGKVTCVNMDLTLVDITEATAIVLYLLPEGIEAIQDKIVELLKGNEKEGKVGVRIVCNTWGFKGWQEIKKVQVEGVNLMVYDVTSLPEELR